MANSRTPGGAVAGTRSCHDTAVSHQRYWSIGLGWYGSRLTSAATFSTVPGASSATVASGSVPQGHACLVAWSNVTGDAVQPTSSVILDNNRAQKNITVIEPPSLFSQFARTFYVHHADAMSDRSMELTFRTDDGQPYKGGVRLHIPPTVKVARVSGAQLIGAYRQLRPLEVCPSDDAHCRAECPDPANPTRFGCTAVYGHVDDPQRLKRWSRKVFSVEARLARSSPCRDRKERR